MAAISRSVHSIAVTSASASASAVSSSQLSAVRSAGRIPRTSRAISLAAFTPVCRSFASFKLGSGDTHRNQATLASPSRSLVLGLSASGRATFSSSSSSSSSSSLLTTKKKATRRSNLSVSSKAEEEVSSYDIDEDADSEQLLADRPLSPLEPTANGDINGEDVSVVADDAVAAAAAASASSDAIPSRGRYDDLLERVGLGGGQLQQLRNLPPKRPLSPNDVFCNRELNLSGIRAVGFDMDYTLAQYHQPQFDKLAFDGAKEKLVKALGYPKEVLDFEYDHTLWVRGLIIDTQRGNFLKIDRHKYVRVAYHGLSPISSITRKHLYNRMFNIVPSFTEKHFVNMDTLFQLVDAHLFALLVDMKDKGEHDVLDMKTYEEIYRQVRECVDLCHRDGVIKDEVARNPEKYIVPDPGFRPMLEGFRDSGVKVFLLTNSYWEYTSVVMNYLYHGRKVEPELIKKNEWLNLVDIAIVGSCKPAYLRDPFLNLFRVRPEDGSLLNTDGLFEIEALGENGAQKFLDMGKTFQGGNWKHLTAMLEVQAGEEILYVGDHLYADVLRSKRTLGWRSCFIVPEIADEMHVFREQLPLRETISDLRQLRDELSLYADAIKRNSADPTSENVRRILAQVEEDDARVKNVLTDLAERYHAAFHPVWGQMFHAGYQDSRFAFFVQNYACLYTSKATNLGLATTSRSFRTRGELLPHDHLLTDPHSNFIEEQ